MNGENQIEGISRQSPTVNWIDSTWFRTLLITVIALGVFFRVSGLGNKIYSHDEIYTSLRAAGYRGGEAYTSLWDGEDKSVDDLQKFLRPGEEKNVLHTLSIIALYQPHQAPLFYLLEHYWMRFVGHTPAKMRGLAAIFGLLSIPAIYWLSWEMFQSPRTAFLSSTIFAISPYHILFAQDARAYSLLALATMLSSAALLRAMGRNDRKDWIIYSLTLTLGVYSHLLFILVAIAHGLYFLALFFLSVRKGIRNFIWSCMIAILTYSPWLYMMITRWDQAASKMDWVNIQLPWYRYIQRWVLLFSSPIIDIDLNSDTANLIPYFLRALALAFIAYGILYLLKRGSQPEKLFLLLIYIITAGSFIVLDLLFGGIRSIAGRYFVPANIATIMVVAYFLAGKMDQAQGRTLAYWRYVLISLMVIGILSNINSLLATSWWNKELGRVRTEFVDEINKDQTLLIVSGSHPTNLGDVLLLGFEIAAHLTGLDDDALGVLVQRIEVQTQALNRAMRLVAEAMAARRRDPV
jgi:uncharacterized membrane protein